MEPRTTIRRARRADARRLTRLAHAAKRHWRYPERLIRLWKPDLTVTPEHIAGEPVYCAVGGTRIIGFYALSGTRATRELEHMWVDPRYLGCGVGRALFAHLQRRLRAMAVRRLEIASDPNAEGFYRRMGARRVGRVASRPAGRTLPLLVLGVPRRTHPSSARMPAATRRRTSRRHASSSRSARSSRRRASPESASSVIATLWSRVPQRAK